MDEREGKRAAERKRGGTGRSRRGLHEAAYNGGMDRGLDVGGLAEACLLYTSRMVLMLNSCDRGCRRTRARVSP